MSKRVEEAALKVCPPVIVKDEDGSLDDLTYIARTWVQKGYEQAEKDIIALIESRISEILGDAQPKPALRAELQELIKRMKEEE